MPAPQALRHHTRTGVLEIVWDEHTSQHLHSAQLRRLCQCGDCKSLRQQTGAAPAIPDRTSITDIRPVGTYAIQIIFSDGHERGIFPWTYLKNLDERKKEAERQSAQVGK